MTTFHGREVSVFYAQETVPGTTDTNASMLSLSQHSEVAWSKKYGQLPIPKSGDVDLATIKKAWTYPVITIKCVPNSGNGKLFIKNFSSTDNYFTLEVKDGGTGVGTTYWRFTGCKVKKITPSNQLYPKAGELMVDIEIWAFAIAFTTAPGIPTFETTPGTALAWSDMTVKIAGSTITNWWEFSWDIENDLEVLPDNTGAVTEIKRGIRKLSGYISRAVSSNQSTEFGEGDAATAKNLEFDFVADQYQFNNSAWDEVGIQAPITGMMGLKLNFVGGQLAIV